MLNFTPIEIPPLATAIANQFGALPQVLAVVLGGSRTTGFANETSDFDFYIYVEEDILIDVRDAIAQRFAQHIEINNQFWEVGDEWIETNSKIGIDIMYRKPQWIEDQLKRLLIDYQASVGYSTCFWWNVLNSVPLFDRKNWFKELQTKAKQPYPEPLKRAIIAKNYPILRKNISAYIPQIEKATTRKDSFSIMHRTTALLASYFDIIFALNSVPHPGEKRLAELVKKLCLKLPEGIEEDLYSLNKYLDLTASNSQLLAHLNRMLNKLDKLLIAEGFIL